MSNIKPFESLLMKLAYRHSLDTVFSDFLEMVICALSGQRMEESYLAVIGRYNKSEQALFPELFGEMVNIMDDSGQGYFDLLGEVFMIHISRGLNGQFFTPQPVTDMMAQMTCGDQQQINKTVCDPACGSGRTLLSAARIMGHANFYFGADLDKICVKMAVINLCLNNLRGQIAHMNSLTMEFYTCYEVYYDPTRLFAPTVRIIDNEQSIFYRHPEALKKAVSVTSDSLGKAIKKQSMAAQLDLFD